MNTSSECSWDNNWKPLDLFLPAGVLFGTFSNSWTMLMSNSSKDRRSWEIYIHINIYCSWLKMLLSCIVGNVGGGGIFGVWPILVIQMNIVWFYVPLVSSPTSWKCTLNHWSTPFKSFIKEKCQTFTGVRIYCFSLVHIFVKLNMWVLDCWFNKTRHLKTSTWAQKHYDEHFFTMSNVL